MGYIANQPQVKHEVQHHQIQADPFSTNTRRLPGRCCNTMKSETRHCLTLYTVRRQVLSIKELSLVYFKFD